MIIRPANLNDVDRLVDYSKEIPPGMTSMPNDRSTWEKKLELADKSFSLSLENDEESRIFFLVLEDMQENGQTQLLGTAGIHTNIGIKRPFYNYKVSKQVMASESLDVTVNCDVLTLVNDFTAATELTSLYLSPKARTKPLGQMLSRCRFLFMHDFPQYFSSMIFAEIRGWLNDQDSSPFWEHIGNKFFNMPFKRADFISAVNGSQFISDLMPRYPLYLNLLPNEVREVLGKPHDGALPAQRLLEKEGFGYRDYVDIFDAGPVLQCEREKIASIQQTRIKKILDVVASTEIKAEQEACFLSNRSFDHYRVTYSNIEVKENGVVIDRTTAEKLNVAPGDHVSILNIR